jgi:phosphatidylserine decarboxylase
LRKTNWLTSQKTEPKTKPAAQIKREILMNYPHPLIAREGWPFLAVLALSALALQLYGLTWSSLAVWGIFLFVLQFFRDPPRHIVPGPGAVVSPADGRIVAVEQVQDPYAQREAIKVSVFMNVFNVHSNRVPIAGTVTQLEYFPGLFVNADLDKASSQNERNAIVIQTPRGDLVTAVQVAGLVARRILCYVRPGEVLEKGERYGFIRFGSRVDVYLPLGSEVKVTIGDKVKASSTLLATLAA